MEFRALPMTVCAALLALVVHGSALAQVGDERILAARAALERNDRATLEQLAARPEGHPLDAYVDYWLWLNRIERDPLLDRAGLEAFLTRQPSKVIGDRLRMAWSKRLAGENDWRTIQSLHAAIERPDDEQTCLGQRAALELGAKAAVAEARAGWLERPLQRQGCADLQQRLVSGGLIEEDLIWLRLQRDIDSRTPQNAVTVARWLAPASMPPAGSLERLIANPATFLATLPTAAGQRSAQELLLAAIVRISRDDAGQAYVRLIERGNELNDEQRAFAYAALGLHGAQSRLPQAYDWYRAAGTLPLSDLQRSWRVRAALRVQNWNGVAESIDALPQSERELPAWVYWRGRAHAAQGDRSTAQRLWQGIAGDTSYYALLAAEELGQRFQPPRRDTPASDADRSRARSDPAVQRALAFYRMRLNTEAVREWIVAVRDREPGFLIAVAEIAEASQLYDRSINTAELAQSKQTRGSHFGLRFPQPYRDLIEPQARANGLDLGWVYGLMRQESRFMIPARSSAGAQGLMQVMPATGDWVARRIGLSGYSRARLADPQTNVLLGTSYMSIITADLDHHPVLVTAGYNAGPGRARRWQGEQALEGAIYAETIPFEETRDYVHKVLANNVIYSAIIDGKPQSLKSRLGTVGPAPAAATSFNP